MTIPLKAKVITFLWLVLLIYLLIIEQGMFGTEEEHVVTVQEKKDELIYDSGWIYLFTDEKNNKYSTKPEIYDEIQLGHTYYIKTGKRSPINGRWYAYYAKELPRNNISNKWIYL